MFIHDFPEFGFQGKAGAMAMQGEGPFDERHTDQSVSVSLDEPGPGSRWLST